MPKEIQLQLHSNGTTLDANHQTLTLAQSPAMGTSSPPPHQYLRLPSNHTTAAANTTSSSTRDEKKKKKTSKKLTLIPLIFLIYFEVSGGPYGAEPAVKAGGPLLAILGFLFFPFIWSIPEALITAELATAYPGNGGYVIWASRAFGPFWGALMGNWKYLSGVINNAAYPVLCADYLSRLDSRFSAGVARDLAIILSTLSLSFLNYTGLTIVGYTAVALGTVSLAPFLFMAGFSIPKLRPERWLKWGSKKKDWSLYFNTLFWNLNFWDNVSTLAGEVDRPQKTFPTALLSAGILTCLGYLIPLLAGIGALDVPQDEWDDGFFADAAGMIAGKWLKYWVEVGAVLSGIGLYEAQLSSCAYQLVGMADLGILPLIFASRAKWFNTPWLGIVISTLITLGITFMSFESIISSVNFLYSLGMLLEFASFIWLRKKYPSLPRPYRVPLRIPGLICMCLIPSGFLVLVMVIATWQVYVISVGLTVFGIGVYYLMGFCKTRGWLQFSKLDGGEAEEKAEEQAAGA